MKLFCAVVREKNIVFDIEIDASKLVIDLKRAIKKEIPDIIKCNAYELKLYLVKQGTEWLQEVDLKVLSVLSKSFKHMKAGLRIDDSGFKFPDENKLGREEIHVLIEIPGSRPLQNHV